MSQQDFPQKRVSKKGVSEKTLTRVTRSGRKNSTEENFASTQLGATRKNPAAGMRDVKHFSEPKFEEGRGGLAKNGAGRNSVAEPFESAVDLEAISGEGGSFDPSAPELQTTWSTYAGLIICVNTYPNGITLSYHSNPESVSDEKPQEESAPDPEGEKCAAAKFMPQQFHLRCRDTRDYQLPVGRYFLHRENYAAAFENQLSQLRKSGMLGATVLYFGTTNDPFLSLHKKFDVTMACMELLERYVPGMTVFQTRSPMIISVLPALKALGEKSIVSMPIESISEKAIARYTPGKPRIGERLVAAEGLRRQGVRVNLMASPVLPYGDAKRDAWDFAEVLDRHGDYITFGCLATGAESDEKQLKSFPIAQKLESDKQYFWLRPHCYQYVYQAVKAIAPEKLILPVKKPVAPSQLKLFAA